MGGFLTSVVDHIVGAVEDFQQKTNEESLNRFAAKQYQADPEAFLRWAQAANPPQPTPLQAAQGLANQISGGGYGALQHATQQYSGIASGDVNVLGPHNIEPSATPLPGQEYGPRDFRPLEFVPPAQGEMTLPSAHLQPQTVAGPQSLAPLAASPFLAAQGVSQGLAQTIGEVPAPSLRSFLPPAIGGEFKVEKIKKQDPVTQFVYQSLPYFLAPAAGNALFLGAMPAQVTQDVQAYQAGELKGGDLLKNLTMTLGPLIAPELLKLGIKTGAEAAHYARSPEGRQLFTKLQSERGGLQGSEPPGAGGEPRPAGDLLPSSATQTPAEMIPPENQLLLQTLQETMPSRQQRAAQLTAGRGRQFGERRTAIDTAIAQGKTPEEALTAGQQGMTGAILDRPDALRDRFSPDHVQSYYKQVLDQEQGGQITSGESIAAKNGLDRLMNGTRSDGTANPVMPHEAEALARVLGPEFKDALPTTPEGMSLFDKVMAPFQLWRSFKTAFDDSFGLGQGWKEIPVNFKGWWKGTKEVKAMLSDENLAAAMEKMRNESPTFVRGQSAKRPLGIMETGGGPKAAEEFLSPVTKRVPLMNVSERRFVARGNIIRQTGLDAMNAMWEHANPGKQVPDDLFQLMVDIENHSTGWGNLKALGKYQSILTQTLFSARGKTALAQYPADLARAALSGDGTLRKIAATRLATWIAMNGVVLASANVAGQAMGIGGVDINPLSTQFGQIKFGPQKIDIWQGYSPIVRAIIQTAKGEQQKPGHIAAQSINRFKPGDVYARGQLSPLASLVYDVAIGQGRNAAGKSVLSRDYWYNQFVPLFVGDTVESLKLMGVAGVPGAVASFEGLRVNTYEPNESPAQIAKANAEAQLKDAGYAPDEQAWEKLATQYNKQQYGSYKDWKAAAYDYYAGQNQGVPEQVLKQRFERLPAVVKMSTAYTNQRRTLAAPFERDPKTRKLLLQAGIIDPKTPADERLLSETP